MKYVTYLIILLSFTAIACKRKNPKTPDITPAFTPVGTWKWVLTTGGIAGVHQTPASTGHSLTYTFRADSTANILTDTSNVNTTYAIEHDTAFLTSGGVTDFLKVQGILLGIMSSHNDTMIITQDFVDGFYFYYVKQ